MNKNSTISGCCLFLVSLLILSTKSHQADISKQETLSTNNSFSINRNTTTTSNLTLNDAATSNSAPTTNLTIESISEKLVKESNLQAEESVQGVVFVEAPPPSSKSQNDQTKSKPAASTFISGGSGNSYMSMAHDGSNRYDFGFDTSNQQRSNQMPQEVDRQQSSAVKRSPRLMREESRLEDGTVIGRYGYTDPFNVFRIVQYVAGPDGYFASEDVGAVDSSSASGQASENGQRPKFQLNKQLYKALEQARAIRHARSSAAATSLTNQAHQLKRSPSKLPNEPSGSPQPHTVYSEPGSKLNTDLSEVNSPDDETLSGSSSTHHSIRFATRINHVLGSNGVTYATAFRPTMSTSVAGNRVVVATVNEQKLHQQSKADSIKPIFTSTRYEHQAPATTGNVNGELYRLAQQDGSLRSRLPAPIYAPRTGEDRQSYSEGDELTLSLQHHQNNLQPVQLFGQQPPGVLQSHPAWSLLNNNYNGNYQTALFIDHSSPSLDYSSQQQPRQQSVVGQTIATNSRREAQLLAALAQRRPEQRTGAFKPVQQTQSVINAGPTVVTSISNSHPFAQFGVRTSASNPEVVTQQYHEPSYNYGFALKHFDAPLYHPEVHETKSDVLTARSQHTHDDHRPGPQSFQYATNIVHSELAAGQDHRPDRIYGSLSDAGLHWAGNASPLHLDELQKSSSDVSATVEVANKQTSSSNNATDKSVTQQSRHQTDHQQGQTELQETPFVGGDRFVAYATRLRAPIKVSGHSWTTDDELTMEDSEPVGYLPNGTHAKLSRARLPDRTKKLSSIFKARTLQADSPEATSESGTASSSLGSTRIRRPIPTNAKRQSQLSSVRMATAAVPVNPPAITIVSVDDKANSTNPDGVVATDSTTSAPVIGDISQQAAINVVSLSDTRHDGDKRYSTAEPKLDTYLQSNHAQTGDSEEKKSKHFKNVTGQAENLYDHNASNHNTEVNSPASKALGLGLIGVGGAIVERTRADASSRREVSQAATAIIVDSSTASRMSSPNQLTVDGIANRDLMEKIMRIQMEIASKTANKEQVGSKLEHAVIDQSPPSTTTASVTTTTMITNSSTTISPIEEASTISKTTTTKPTTRPITTKHEFLSVSGQVDSGSNSTIEIAKSTEPIKLNLMADNELATTTKKDNPAEQPPQHFMSESKNFLTGPLLRIDSPSTSDQEDFMVNLSRDMNTIPFDSTRAQVMSDSNVKLVTTNTVTGNKNIEGTNQPTINSTTGQFNIEPVAHDRQLNVTHENRQTEIKTKTQMDLKQPDLNKDSSTSVTTMSSNVTILNDTNRTQADDITRNQTSSEIITTTTTTTTARPHKQRTTGQPARFGRLVIKRGDKVVARFNASDSIPDSMIPTSVGGAGEIIVPDMPRLGMRRSMGKKRVQQAPTQSEADKLTKPTAATTMNEKSPTISLNATKSRDTLLGDKAIKDLKASTAPTTTSTTTLTKLVPNLVDFEPRNSTQLVELSSPGLSLSMSPVVSASELSLIEAPSEVKRKKSLQRGARSSGLDERQHDLSDLLVSESNILSSKHKVRSVFRDNSTTSKQPSKVEFGARNWSTRLRVNDMIGHWRPDKNESKKYDPSDDLKKLVEKIERIQFETFPNEPNTADRLERLGRGKLEVVDHGNPSNGTEDLNRRFDVAALKDELQQDKRNNSVIPKTMRPTITDDPKTVPINFSKLLSQTNSSKLLTNALAPSQHPFLGTLAVAATNRSQSDQTVNGTLLHKSNARNATLSSSIAFTVVVSPDIENQWNKLKPINMSQQILRNERASPLLATILTKISPNSSNETTASNIRVDTHGHIHVRNNQSITVHVDIEPPRRLDSKMTSENVTNTLADLTRASKKMSMLYGSDETTRFAMINSGQQKRISNRDTLAVLQFERDGDIRRVKADAPKSSTTVQIKTEQNSTPTSPTRIDPIKTAERGPSSPRSRILCIEVENDGSESRRSKLNDLGLRKLTQQVQTNISPDV